MNTEYILEKIKELPLMVTCEGKKILFRFKD